MEEFKLQWNDNTISFQKAKIPLFQQETGSISLGIWNNKNVIIKCCPLAKLNHDDPEREKEMLEKINEKCPTERIFMKLLVYIKTDMEHIFILEKAKMDLFTYVSEFLPKLDQKDKIGIIYRLGYLTNRLHELGFANCDISLENIVIYGKGEFAFIDAAQVQEDNFDVNIPNKPHPFDNTHPGKMEYELPDAHYGKPFHLQHADKFAMRMIMWFFMFGKLPFNIDKKNPKQNLVAYQDRSKFANGEYDQLLNVPNMQLFFDFLATSKLSFNLEHAFFK